MYDGMTLSKETTRPSSEQIRCKYLIITDERTGCSEFTDYFCSFDLQVLHDPQTILKDSNHHQHDDILRKTQTNEISDVETIFPILYMHYDVIKVCLCSYDIPTYLRLVSCIHKLNATILVVYRNPFDRALSKCISVHFTQQIRLQGIRVNYSHCNGYGNQLYDFYEPFYIDMDMYQTQVKNFYEKIHHVLTFMTENEIPFSYLDISEWRHRNDFTSLAEFYATLELDLTWDMYEKIKNKIDSYCPVDKKRFVLNLEEIDNFNKNFILGESNIRIL